MMREPGELGGSSQTHKVFERTPPGGWKARTYSLTPNLVHRLDSLAEDYEVGQSDMARFLLKIGLEEVESGRVEVPTKTFPGRFVDVDW